MTLIVSKKQHLALENISIKNTGKKCDFSGKFCKMFGEIGLFQGEIFGKIYEKIGFLKLFDTKWGKISKFLKNLGFSGNFS